MASLYELTGALGALHALLDEEDLDDEQVAGIEADVARLLRDLIPEKVAGYCALMADLDAEAEMFRGEERRLATRRKARESLHERLKSRLLVAMQEIGQRKLAAGTWTLAVQASPPSLEVISEAEIPAAYWVPQAPSLDKRSLLAAAKLGPVPGVSIRQGEHLRIR